MRQIAALIFIISVFVFAGADACAGTERELTYKQTQVWRSAVRFLRVDQGFKIIEKDKSTGYILFKYQDSGRTYQASMEIVPTVKQQRKVVLVKMNISSMPSYITAVLFDKFSRKLKNEYGTPPPAEIVLSQVDEAKKIASKDAQDLEEDEETDEDNVENKED